jgi:hypothetical protein
MSEAPTGEAPVAGAPTAATPTAGAQATQPGDSSERDLASLLLAIYFVGLIVIVVALLVVPAIL